MSKPKTEAWAAAVPPELRALDRWCGWRGSKKPLDPRTGTAARVNDPATWGSFSDAKRWYKEHEAEPDAGCGFVFTEGDGLVFLDLDHCVVKDTAEPYVKAWALPLADLLTSSTYVEVSPSGTGLHAFALGELPRAAGVTGARVEVEDGAVEAYADRRFSTVTGRRWNAHTRAGPVPRAILEAALPPALLTKLSRPEGEAAPAPREALSRRHEVWEALQAIDPDCSNDEWVQVGMALKAAFGDDGFPLWRKWSSTGSKYKEGEPEQRWASFKRAGGVSLGTVFHMARARGWRPVVSEADEDAWDERKRSFAVAPLSDFPDESYHWLVRDLGLLKGYAALLVGDGGHGKSTMMLDVAARLTTGRPMPWETAARDPCRVFYLNAEDGVGDTIKPRARAAGADLSRIDVLDLRAKGMRVPQLPDDVEDLEDMLLERPDVQLVVIDPLNAFLSGEVDAHKAHDVRQALQPLRDALQRAGRSVCIVSHLNKNQALDAFYRISGSADQGNFVRAAMLVAPDPDAEEEPVEVLSPLKWNYGPKPPSREFRIVGAEGDVGHVEWGEVSELTADETLRPKRDDGGGATRRAEAEAWLRKTLGAGPMLSRELEPLARAAGIPQRTLDRAAKHLGLRREKTAEGWQWPQVQTFEEEP